MDTSSANQAGASSKGADLHAAMGEMRRPATCARAMPLDYVKAVCSRTCARTHGAWDGKFRKICRHMPSPADVLCSDSDAEKEGQLKSQADTASRMTANSQGSRKYERLHALLGKVFWKQFGSTLYQGKVARYNPGTFKWADGRYTSGAFRVSYQDGSEEEDMPLEELQSLIDFFGTSATKISLKPEGGKKRGRTAESPRKPEAPPSSSTGPQDSKGRLERIDKGARLLIRLFKPGHIKRFDGIGIPMALALLLKSGLLAGIDVEYRKAEATAPLIRGRIGLGSIVCTCVRCQSGRMISLEEFSAHAGDAGVVPEDHIYFSKYGLSLKEFASWIAYYATKADLEPASKSQKVRSEPETSQAAAKTNMACPVRRPSQQQTASGAMPRYARTKVVFEMGGLEEGTLLSYQRPKGNETLTGEVKRDGVLCHCCNTVISPGRFEIHAGFPHVRSPFSHIYLQSGERLADVADRLVAEMRKRDRQDSKTPQEARVRKVTAALTPDEVQAEKPTMNNKSAIVSRCNGLLEELAEPGVGCVHCGTYTFDKDGFSNRTVMLCDQCEREFHVGCLKAFDGVVLASLPEGDWFCSKTCNHVNGALLQMVGSGEQPLLPCHLRGFCWQKEYETYSWQLMRGSDGKNTKCLSSVHRIMKKSFKPIYDPNTNKDMIPAMVYSQVTDTEDCRNFFSLALCRGGDVVCCSVIRFFGAIVAEAPLVATDVKARRRGHCRVLVSLMESIFDNLGIPEYTLPSAQTQEHIWRHLGNDRTASFVKQGPPSNPSNAA